ncbi:MAG: 4'-phosphopantetheinyl transferase superfamily protein [Planctomycetales bacterium]|nr:4'-phosphopantetheinyl transferase superfamily protein [Planctomycetales bacterium]
MSLKPHQHETRTSSESSPQVEVWRAAHADLDTSVVARFESWLTDEERTRQLRYRRPEDQLRFAVGRGMLRTLLSKHTGVPPQHWLFQLGPYGRPEAATNGSGIEAPAFNLSHSRGVTVAAISADVSRLGADVETLERGSHWSLARRFFAPSEAAVVEDADVQDKEQLFLRFWTLKEAYVKAVGQGITLGLDTFCFELFDDAPPSVQFRRSSSADDVPTWKPSPGQRPADTADMPDAHRPKMPRGAPERWHFDELLLSRERVAVAMESLCRPRVTLRSFTEVHELES